MQLNLINLGGLIICWENSNSLFSVWLKAKFCWLWACAGNVTCGPYCNKHCAVGYMHCDCDHQLQHGCHHHSDPCSPVPNKTQWCEVSSMIGEGKPVMMGLPLGFLVRSWSTFNQPGRDSWGVTPGQGPNPVGHKANPGNLGGFRQTLLVTSEAESSQIFCLPKTRQVRLTQRAEWVEPPPTATRQARLTTNA